MDKIKIINFLKQNELEDIEELTYKDEAFVVRFYYDFDEDEIEAAKAYSNDESEDEEEGEIWVKDFFIPYLSDMAADNVGEVIEEIMEDYDLDAQFMSYELDEENYCTNEFVAVFYKKGIDLDIEKVFEELEL